MKCVATIRGNHAGQGKTKHKRRKRGEKTKGRAVTRLLTVSEWRWSDCKGVFPGFSTLLLPRLYPARSHWGPDLLGCKIRVVYSLGRDICLAYKKFSHYIYYISGFKRCWLSLTGQEHVFNTMFPNNTTLLSSISLFRLEESFIKFFDHSVE